MFTRTTSRFLRYGLGQSSLMRRRAQHRLFAVEATGGSVENSVSPWLMYWPSFKARIDWRKKPEPVSQAPESQDKDEQQYLMIAHKKKEKEFQQSEQQIHENGYDMIVECDRLEDLNENGWPIHMDAENNLWYGQDEKGNKRLMPEKKSKVKTVAVSGIFNTGKTFFVNNLCTVDLPSSDSTSTKGLSIKRLSTMSEILIMDTAGANSAIEVTGESSLSDKISSEKILQNTIYDIANFHVCVVNKLTWPDQHHFEMIYDKVWESNINENGKTCTQQFPLYIIHNFRDKSLIDLRDTLLESIKLAYRKKGRFRCSKFVGDGKEEAEFRKLIDELIEEDKKSTTTVIEDSFKESAQSVAQSMQEKIDASRKGLWGHIELPKLNAEDIERVLKQSVERKAREQQSTQWKQQKVEELQARFAQRASFWFDSKGDNTTKHLFLVDNNASEAAQAFNFLVFEQMRRELQGSFVNTENSFSLKKVFDSLSQNLAQYVKLVDERGNFIRFARPLRPHICFVGNDEKPEFRLILDPELKATIKLKKASELEYNALFIGATSWKPKYDVHYAGDICTVWLELPGNIENISVALHSAAMNDDSSMLSTLKINGTREREDGYTPDEFSIDDKVDRTFGDFEFKINLKKEYTTFADDDDIPREDGVLIIKLKKEKQNTTKTVKKKKN